VSSRKAFLLMHHPDRPRSFLFLDGRGGREAVGAGEGDGRDGSCAGALSLTLAINQRHPSAGWDPDFRADSQLI
jgi:hypothetical protein